MYPSSTGVFAILLLLLLELPEMSLDGGGGLDLHGAVGGWANQLGATRAVTGAGI